MIAAAGAVSRERASAAGGHQPEPEGPCIDANVQKVVRSERVDSRVCSDGGDQMAAVAGCVVNIAGVESGL